MRLSMVIDVAGRILRILGFMFFVPVMVSLAYNEREEVGGFLLGGAVTLVLAQAMVRATRESAEDLRRIEALTVVAGTWLVVALLGAIPYIWVGLSPIDSLFESMSGFTTTGATILVDFGQLGRGVMFWRSLSQWLGGMGVITLFVAVLPRLAFGVRQLFFVEAPGPTDDKLTPHISQTAAYLWRLYTGLTLAEFVALLTAGMSWYDALCHSMTTLAAGGFSSHPESIMGFQNPAVEWIICAFMFLAGANFALQYRALLGRPGALLRDDEFRVYTAIVAVSASGLALFLWMGGGQASVRTALFQTLSVLTTTSYASADFDLWTDQTKVILLALMFIGGCAGSAAGGPKVLRHVLVGRYTLAELRRTLHPRAVLPIKHGREGRARRDHAVGARLLPLLHTDVRGVRGGRHWLRRGHRDRANRDDRDARQHRSWARAGRADGELQPPAFGQQSGADRGDVDRPFGGANRAGASPMGGVALLTLAGAIGSGLRVKAAGPCSHRAATLACAR